jgi:hypothetical protein
MKKGWTCPLFPQPDARPYCLPAREILAAAKAGQANVPDAFVISDESGRALDTVALAEVLPEALKRRDR